MITNQVKKWAIILLLLSVNSFGLRMGNMGGVELSFPYLLRLNADKVATAKSEDMWSGRILGVGGVHLGMMGAGFHLGPTFLLSGENRISVEITSSYIWMNLPKIVDRDVYNGASIGYSYLIEDGHFVIPLKVKFEFMEKAWFRNGNLIGGSVGVGI